MTESSGFKILESKCGTKWEEVEYSNHYGVAYRTAKDRSLSKKDTYQRITAIHSGGASLCTFKNGNFIYNKNLCAFDGQDIIDTAQLN